MKRCLFFGVSAILLSALIIQCVFPAFAENFPYGEKKTYSSATLNDDFVDNHVMIVLNNQASMEYLSSGVIDFPEIDHEKIRDISAYKGKKINAMVEARRNMSIIEKIFTIDHNREDISSYRQLLCIELKEHSKENVLKVIEILEQREEIQYAGPDFIFSVSSSATNDLFADEQWALETIDLPMAWDMSASERTVRVCVLDSGIDANHPDLQGKVNQSRSKDFVTYEPRSPLTDPLGHGTHVAGIIGAIVGNGEGTAGVCWNVELISVRVIDSYNQGIISDFCEAMVYISEGMPVEGDLPINVPIVNFSGGWDTDIEQEQTDIYTAVYDYLDEGGLFVCGAGNDVKYVINKLYPNHDPGDIEKMYYYPASLDFGELENSVIVVGASNREDNDLWDDGVDQDGDPIGSNSGKYAVDIFAPGEGILSCYPLALCRDALCTDIINHRGYGYHYNSGTSMATPFVTGVAALMLSIHPDMTAAQIKRTIKNTAEKVTENGVEVYKDLCSSDGRLNAYDALYACHIFGDVLNGSLGCQYRECTECHYIDAEPHTFGQWDFLDASNHTHTCSNCAYTETVSHNFMKEFRNQCVFFTCVTCGYYEEQHDSNVTIAQNDAQTHLEICSCGQTTEVAHRGAWVDLNATYHQRTCTDCGYVQLQTHLECWNHLKDMCMACKRKGPISGGSILVMPPEEEEWEE